MAQNRMEKMAEQFEPALFLSANELTSQGFTDAKDIAEKIWNQAKNRAQKL